MKAVFDLSGPAPILLLVNRICLPIIVIVALHFNGLLYDMQWSMEDMDKPNSKLIAPYFGGLHFSGANWGLTAGLWGLGAIIFFVVSFFVQFPKWLKWIYLVGAFLIMFTASFGLGMNTVTAEHGKCMKLKEAKARGCSIWLKELSPLVFIFAVSFAQAMTYVATFLLAHFGEGGEVGGCPCLKKGGGGSGNQDQAAGDQQIQDQPLQPRMSATKAPPMDAEAPPP